MGDAAKIAEEIRGLSPADRLRFVADLLDEVRAAKPVRLDLLRVARSLVSHTAGELDAVLFAATMETPDED